MLRPEDTARRDRPHRVHSGRSRSLETDIDFDAMLKGGKRRRVLLIDAMPSDPIVG